jgi:hypothetical protein
MKRALVSLSLLTAVSLGTMLGTGCAKHESYTAIATDSAQTVSTQTAGNAVDHVASDPELLRQALILADSKGTLQSALTEAAQDSMVGIRMRTALILGTSAKSKSTAPPTTPTPAPTSKKSSGKSTSQAKPKGDVLDQANSGLDKVNNTVTKSGQVIDKAADVNKKVGDILNKKH